MISQTNVIMAFTILLRSLPISPVCTAKVRMIYPYLTRKRCIFIRSLIYSLGNHVFLIIVLSIITLPDSLAVFPGLDAFYPPLRLLYE